MIFFVYYHVTCRNLSHHYSVSSVHMWVHYGVVISTYVGPLGCGHHYICGSIRVWSSLHICGSIMVWSSLHMWVH